MSARPDQRGPGVVAAMIICPILGGTVHYGTTSRGGHLWPVCRTDHGRWGEYVEAPLLDVTCPDCLEGSTQ